MAYETAAGYAIPVDQTFRRVVDALRDGKEVEYGFLGVFSENSTVSADAPDSRPEVRIRQVVPGTPATLAGLVQGDIITHIGDASVANTDEFMLSIGRCLVGSEVPLRIVRDTLELTVQATLAKKPVVRSRSSIVSKDDRWWRGMRYDHATVSTSFARLATSTISQVNKCVAVTDVHDGTPAWQQGLLRGMFISHVPEQKLVRLMHS